MIDEAEWQIAADRVVRDVTARFREELAQIVSRKPPHDFALHAASGIHICTRCGAGKMRRAVVRGCGA